MNGLQPSIWLKQSIPLFQKGLVLTHSYLFNSKLYYFFNSRIVQYCEFLDLFVDEQNGFRPKTRSCEDHIFALKSIINRQLNTKQNVYAAFIDIEFCFGYN